MRRRLFASTLLILCQAWAVPFRQDTQHTWDPRHNHALLDCLKMKFGTGTIPWRDAASQNDSKPLKGSDAHGLAATPISTGLYPMFRGKAKALYIPNEDWHTTGLRKMMVEITTSCIERDVDLRVLYHAEWEKSLERSPFSIRTGPSTVVAVDDIEPSRHGSDFDHIELKQWEDAPTEWDITDAMSKQFMITADGERAVAIQLWATIDGKVGEIDTIEAVEQVFGSQHLWHKRRMPFNGGFYTGNI